MVMSAQGIIYCLPGKLHSSYLGSVYNADIGSSAPENAQQMWCVCVCVFLYFCVSACIYSEKLQLLDRLLVFRGKN